MLVVFVGLLVISGINGHGMMLDPPNRSSLWRFNSSFPINYDDNQNFCGGFEVQWSQNNGKCGVCGDSYSDPIPRKNENTGVYGTGYIVASYPSGSVINVHVRLTANHKGTLSYSLCKIEDSSLPESETCFTDLKLQNNEQSYNVSPDDFDVYNSVQLPSNFVCSHCVLRWYYNTGNRWGTCEDNTEQVGCGPQETFWSCSDISIY